MNTGITRILEGTPIDDLESISRVLIGDKQAFAELVRKYQGKVRAYCYSMLTDREAAEDAAQEVFIKVFRSLDRFKADSSFSTWLYRITANHCMDLLRKRARENNISWDALTEKTGEPHTPLHSNENPLSVVEHKDLLGKVLSVLNLEYREIIILREVQELSYEEIAEVLQCSLDAVKARLKRARKQLVEKSRHLRRAPNVELTRSGT